jgi:hypothetical protein
MSGMGGWGWRKKKSEREREREREVRRAEEPKKRAAPEGSGAALGGTDAGQRVGTYLTLRGESGSPRVRGE